MFAEEYGGAIKLFGGEPLLRPHVVRAAMEEARRHAAIRWVYLSTNGLGAHRGLAPLPEGLPKGILTISLDGRPEDHRAERVAVNSAVPDAYDHVVSLKDKLLRTPRVVITQTIAPERAVNADANLAHLLELGFWRFNFLPGYYIPWTIEQVDDLEQAFQQMSERIQARWRQGDKDLRPQPVHVGTHAILQHRLRRRRRPDNPSVECWPLRCSRSPSKSDGGGVARRTTVAGPAPRANRARQSNPGEQSRPSRARLHSYGRRQAERLLSRTVPALGRLKAARERRMSEDTQISELGLAEDATPWIGPNGKVMERLELHLTYTRPERCVFCSEADRMKRYKQFPVTWGHHRNHPEDSRRAWGEGGPSHRW